MRVCLRRSREGCGAVVAASTAAITLAFALFWQTAASASEVPSATDPPAPLDVPALGDVPPTTEVPAATEVPPATDAPPATELPGATDAPPATGLPDLLQRIQLHGFVSQGFLKTTANDYLVDSSAGSFEYGEVGFNVTAHLSDKLRVGMQLFAFELGNAGRYNVKADWFYLDYRLRDWLGLRAGRLKIPYGLYNDISDIDAARAPALLPSSIYPAMNRNFLLSQSGFEIYGYIPAGRAGAFDYRIYAGTVPYELPPQDGAAVPLTSVRVPYLTGFRFLWETPLDGLRVGLTSVALRATATASFPPPMLLTITSKEVSGVGSVEYAAHDLLVAAEYGRTQIKNHYEPVLVPDTSVTAEGAYLMSAYRLTPWLQPAAYYSVYFPNHEIREGRQNVQHDLSATLRFDVTDFWIIKLEAH